MLLGNGLIAHIRKLQEYRRNHTKLPAQPYLTYTQLVDQTGAKLAMVGIGNPLDEVMTAVHEPGVPQKMRGLTMFVRPKNGGIAYGTGNHDWHGINARTSCNIVRTCLSMTGPTSRSFRQKMGLRVGKADLVRFTLRSVADLDHVLSELMRSRRLGQTRT